MPVPRVKPSITKSKPPAKSPGRPAKSPGRPAKSPGRPAKSPGRPAKSPGRPAKSPGRPAKSPGRPAKSPEIPESISPSVLPKSPGRPAKPLGRNIKTKSRSSEEQKTAPGDAKQQNELFDVEGIIASREDKQGTRMYFVRWKGFGPDGDTWEPASNFETDALLRQFDVKTAEEVAKLTITTNKDTFRVCVRTRATIADLKRMLARATGIERQAWFANGKPMDPLDTVSLDHCGLFRSNQKVECYEADSEKAKEARAKAPSSSGDGCAIM